MDNNLMKNIISINPPAIEEFIRTPDKFSNLFKLILEMPILGTFLYNIATLETKIHKTLRDKYFFNPQLVSTKMFDTYYESAHKEKSHGKYLLASMTGHYLDNAIEHALKNMEIPVYIIESNHLINSITILETYRRINHFIVTDYISNTGLIPQLEMPDKILQMIDSFLDEKTE